MGNVTMSIKESKQIGVLEHLKEGRLTQKQAALKLGISDRQIRRKLQRFLLGGASAIVHKLRCRPSNNQINFELKQRALGLIADKYADFGPTLASEQLAKEHGIKISAETLRCFMAGAGLWRIKKQRIKHRKWRERRPSFGHMALFDGSPHAWLEDRGPYCTLLLYIDDATSRILAAAFVDGESTKNAMQVSREYFIRYGLPLEIYTDRGSVFKVNVNNPDNEHITQYERALGELAVTLIRARSPQAKGRVERCFQTLQDRLVKELRLANISSIEAANQYLKGIYIPKHNARFAVHAHQVGDMHRPIPGNLEDILCIKTTRILQQDFTLQYHNRILQLHAQQRAVIRPKESITVQENLDDTLKLSIRGITLHFIEINHRPIKPKKPIIVSDEIHRPRSDHPWRKSYKNMAEAGPKVGYLR